MSLSLNCLNLPVFTQNGTYLGKIVGVEVDASGSQVIYFQVKPTPLALSLIGNNYLLISPTQIISLSQDKMVVQDTTTTNKDLIGNLAVESSPQ